MALRTRTTITSAAALPQIDIPLPAVLPLEEYVAKFAARYRGERTFRDIVHTYLKLSTRQRFDLTLSKYLLPPRYRRRSEEFIRQYAGRIRGDLLLAHQAREELQELQRREEDLAQRAAEVRTVADAEERMRNQYAQAEAAHASAIRGIDEDFAARAAALEERVSTAVTEIQQATDVHAIVTQALTRTVERLPFLCVDRGQLEFDEGKMVERLQTLFLDEIVEGIEREDGTGFLARVKMLYRDLLTHWGEMEDVAQIDEVDWVESIILSRTKGFRYPMFPHMIVPHYDQSAASLIRKASVDTAISVDGSGSMDMNYRFVVARKAAFATAALMRQLNPRNQTYFSVFRDAVEELTALDMLRAMKAGGGTRTELALDWMRGKLQDSGPSFAYLITDGDPNSPDQAIAAAAKYRGLPIFLRIFLIDGNAHTEGIIREIGKAAGPQTKVLPVKDYQMGSGMLRDIAQSLKGMYDITHF